ncbi:MAG: response regulator [Rhodomicrobium sp.]|nr:MAG: response regulator [Rhodomicrobium sp.]
MSKSVLIIEDEPFIIEALSFLLEREGIDFDCSTDGEGCLDIIESRRPDLVILDMMLPQMNGMEVLQSLRNTEAFKALPVLMLTAKGQKKDRKAAEDAGVSLFMTKPFANDELIANVHRLLDE